MKDESATLLPPSSPLIRSMTKEEQGRAMSPASPRTAAGLKAAEDWFRRKLDKIPTPNLRAAYKAMTDAVPLIKDILQNPNLLQHLGAYHQQDVITGERFYLTVDEVKAEISRREGVAERMAAEMYEVYRQAVGGLAFNKDVIPPWEHIQNSSPRLGWIATAEAVMEKYRCLL